MKFPFGILFEIILIFNFFHKDFVKNVILKSTSKMIELSNLARLNPFNSKKSHHLNFRGKNNKKYA